MWIILSIIGLYYWLIKRRKRSRKQGVSINNIVLFVVFVVTAVAAQAQNKKVSILGEIVTTPRNNGQILVFLVDQAAFDKPLSGIDTLVLKPTEEITLFKFEPIDAGVYGIRCFQDVNSNGKLDRKMFFPDEPYGFSWQKGKKFPIRFADISFTANSNCFVSIKLEQ